MSVKYALFIFLLTFHSMILLQNKDKYIIQKFLEIF